jgi:hypothetical protein
MLSTSLRRTVKNATGQDVYLCRGCRLCDIEADDEMDVPLTTILQMVMYDDDEVLTCRTLWSDRVLVQASRACKRGLNLHNILMALREEANQRNIFQ